MQTFSLTPSMQARLLSVAYLALAALMVVSIVGASSGAASPEVSQPQVPPKLPVDDAEADAALLRGEWEAAARLHRMIIQDQPDNGRAHYHLGYAYGQLGKFSDEITAYEEAVRLGVREPLLYYNLGIALATALEDYEGAIGAFQEGLRLAPGDPEIWYNLGVAYLSKRDFARARDVFQAALARKPDHLEARNNLAQALLGLGDRAGARAAWETILKKDPGNALALKNLRWLDTQGGRGPGGDRP